MGMAFTVIFELRLYQHVPMVASSQGSLGGGAREPGNDCMRMRQNLCILSWTVCVHEINSYVINSPVISSYKSNFV